MNSDELSSISSVMNFQAFHLSFKEHLTVHYVLLSNCLLELKLVRDIRITGHVFDHVSALFYFCKQRVIFCN